MHFLNYDFLKNLPAIGATVLLIAGVSSLTILLMRICEEERRVIVETAINFEMDKDRLFPGREFEYSASTHVILHRCTNDTCLWECSRALHSFSSSLDHFDSVTLFNNEVISRLVTCIFFLILFIFVIYSIWIFINLKLAENLLRIRAFLYFIFYFCWRTFKNWLLLLETPRLFNFYFILFFIVFFFNVLSFSFYAVFITNYILLAFLLILLFDYLIKIRFLLKILKPASVPKHLIILLSVLEILFFLIRLVGLTIQFFMSLLKINTVSGFFFYIMLIVFYFLIIIPEFFISGIQVYILYFIINNMLSLRVSNRG